MKKPNKERARGRLRSPLFDSYKESKQMANKSNQLPEVVKPTPKQSYEIFEMLQVAYDRKNQRYTKAETDQSIAKELGIERWGWVSQVREQFFGPAGNEEDHVWVKGLEDWLKKTDGQVEEIQIALASLETSRKEAKALLTKVKNYVNAQAAA